MTNPIEITDEMRAAVMRELCDKTGHVFVLQNLMRREVDGDKATTVVGSMDGETLPHITCERCDKTWIMIDEPGEGYDDTEMKLRDRLYKSDPINKRPERPRRGGR